MEDWLESLSTNNEDRLDDWDEPTRPDGGIYAPQGKGKANVQRLERSKQIVGNDRVCKRIVQRR